jgi:hypothetical protein
MRRLLAVGLGLGLGFSMVVPGVARAGPEPDPAAGRVVWLDRPLPSAAAPGSTVRISGILWDPTADAPVPHGRPFVRIRPASGAATPAEVYATEDWAGHFVANLTVPRGGLGAVEIGVVGQLCNEETGCVPIEGLFPLAGAGPPAGAAAPVVYSATIEPPAVEPAAGQAFEVIVRLEPRADWPPDALAPPASLTLLAGEPRGPDVASARAEPTGSDRLTYTASLTLSSAGDYVLEAAAGDGSRPADRFPLSVLPITVAEAPSALGGVAADPPLLVWLGALGAVAIGGLAVAILAGRRRT